MNLVRLADIPPTPWRNGGGTTRELLAWPRAADWLVRVSVARIAADGPFSPFPGVQRWFTVLGGAGVRLTHGEAERELRPGDEPWGFDGADAPGCTLIDGPTEDLNLMSRRDAGPAAMVPLRPGAAPAAASASRWLGVYTTAPLTLRAAGTTLDIPADCLAWTDARGTDAWHADTAPGTRAWWLTLDRDGG